MVASRALPQGYEIRRGRADDCDALPAIEEAAAVRFNGLGLIPEGQEIDGENAPGDR